MGLTRRDILAFASGAAITSAAFGVNAIRPRPDWINVSPEAPQFSIRDSARGFEYQGKLWLSGGYMVNNVARRDLLSSDDGVHWTMINENTPFAAYSPIESHNGLMMATFPSLMASEDGKTWRDIQTTGDQPPLASEKPIKSFQDKLYIFADDGTYVLTGTVWRKVGSPFGNRLSFSAAVHDGAIYVAGGALKIARKVPERGYPGFTSLNEVWRSTEPENPNSWEKVAAAAEWRQRMWPGFISHGGWLWIIDGYVNQIGENIGDTWRSRDGAKWERFPTLNVVPARHAPTVFSRHGRILVVAGNTNTGTSVQNDIWSLSV